MDVMGGTLQDFPVQNIGFNQNIGWTHTVSKLHRFIVYKFDLIQESAMKYTVDMIGHWLAINLATNLDE